MKSIRSVIASAVSGVFVFSALSLQAALPPTAGLQLWLNADVGVTANGSGQISAWADQSGQGNHATQPTASSAPVIQPASLNGHATVRVTGSQFMEVASANAIANLLNDVSIITVAKYDNLAGYRGVLSKCNGGSPAPFDFWHNAGANGGRTSFYLGNGTAANATLSTVPPPVNVYNVLSFRWKDGLSSQFLNDVSNGEAANAVAIGDIGTTLRIGRRLDGTVQLIGNVAEILIYQPALSDTDLYDVINNYLKPKYALVFNAAPSVSITSPGNGASFTANTSIPLTINASDTDGYPASVAVYGNGILLGTGTAVNINSSSSFSLNVAGVFPGVMTLTAVATDNSGRSSTSSPVNINITGSAGPAAPVLTGLKSWLRADAGTTLGTGGVLTNWADQSGTANDAVQIDETLAPTILAGAVNGKPAVHFTGAPQFLEVSDSGTAFLTNDFTTFAVARFVGSYPAARQHVWSKCGSTGLAGPIDWWFNTTTGVPFGYRGDGVNFIGVGGIAGPPLGAFTLVGMSVTGADGGISHYLGSLTNGSGFAPTNTANAGFPLRIGRRVDNVTQINGDIAEILLYDQALSVTDRSNVTAYLAAKYSLVQPYNTNPRPVITITSPADGGSFPAPKTVTFSATASSANSTIVRVTLSANGQTFATITNAPYQVNLDLLTPGTVLFTAVATDNWGVQTAATPVTMTITGTSSAPPLTTGLKTWLAADLGVTTNAAGAVVSWVDQSSSGNDAAAPDPALSPILVPSALNGKPVLRYNGGNQVLEVPAANTGFTAGDISTFAIAKINNYSTFRTIWSKAQANRPAPVDWYFASGSGAANVFRGSGPGALGNIVGAAPQAGPVQVLGFKCAGPAISQYIGYNLTGSGNIAATPIDTGFPLRIGRRADGATQMNGDIAEILIYDHAVTESERLQIVNYLYAKWGITVVQVANVAPTITLTSPTNGTPVSAPTTIGMVASVTDPDSPITRVDFFANGLLVASRTAAPYQIPLQVLSPGPLVLQARATDFWGAMGTSAPVTLTVTGTGPASPPASGKVLWLRADAGVTTNVDGTVATWADQSGNNNDAAQDAIYSFPSPTLVEVGGSKMLNYDSTSRFLVIPNSGSLASLTNDMSLFSATSVDDFAATRTIVSKGSIANSHPFDYFFNTAGNAQVNRGDNRGTSAAVSGPVPAGTNIVTGFTVEGSIGNHYLQGLFNGTGQFGYGTIDDGTSMYIGSRDDLVPFFKGNIGEVLVYDRLLVGSELDTVNAYLGGRYGVATAQLNTQPPVLSVTKNGAATVQLSWLPGYAGFVLESRTTNVAAGAWTPIVTNPPNNQVTIGTTNAARFFRLRSQ